MKNLVSIALIFAVVVSSCNRDEYLIDGGVASPELNMSTYEFLASRTLFDTLVMAINKAGLRELLDKEEVTFFAPTNFSFKSHMDERTRLGKTSTNNPDYVFTFEDFTAEELRDSLQSYIFSGKIYRQDLTPQGYIFTALSGTQSRISLEPRKDYTDQLTTNPSYVYLTRKRGLRWDAWDAENVSNTEKDVQVRIQTSGLISTNGVIHVLPNNHRLFFLNQLN